MIKLSAIQLNSKANVAHNLRVITKQLEELTATDLSSENNDLEHLVVLPECCLFFGSTDKAQLLLAEQTHENNDLQTALSDLAKKFNVTLIAGTIPLLTDDRQKFSNTCCAFDYNGKQIGRYDKIHLFDVNVEDNEKSYCESRFTKAGTSPCLVKGSSVNVGLTVCFDVRFPALFQKLTSMGADIITVPSAFTRVTGKAHWQTLLQARAIENQVYIIAAGQEGVHENGRETWGHSMIISPWGEILASLTEGEGIISCDFNPEEIKRIRASMPLQHALEI